MSFVLKAGARLEAIRGIISASVSMSIDTLARSFRVSIADQWTKIRSARDVPFIEGDQCILELDGHVIVDGFVDEIVTTYDAQSHTISVTGRSWCGNLVDSTAIVKGGEWKDATLLRIANDIARPFGVTFSIDPSAASLVSKPFRRWAIDEEETAFECIARAAKMRGVFMVSDSGRGVSFSVAGSNRMVGALGYGKRRVLSCSRSGRMSERHSEIQVKSQNATSDTWFAGDASNNSVKVSDPGVPMHRPLVLVSDGQGSRDELEKRAKWELATRAGKSRQLTYRVVDYYDDAGQPFRPNWLVNVDDDVANVHTDLLLSSVELELSDGGRLSTLELFPPSAFNVLIEPERRGRGFL